MGGFFKSIAKLGLMGAATAAGGPIAGLGVSAGTGMLEGALKGGNLGSMLMGGGTGALGSYLGGELGPKVESTAMPQLKMPNFDPTLKTPSLLEALKFDYNK